MQFNRSQRVDLVDVLFQQVGHDNLVVETVLLGEVDFAVGVGREVVLQFGHRHGFGNADLCGEGADGGLVADPDNVIDGKVVAEENSTVLVNVNNGGE